MTSPYRYYNSLSLRKDKPVTTFERDLPFYQNIKNIIELWHDPSDDQPIVRFQVSAAFRSTLTCAKPEDSERAIRPNITQWSPYKKEDKHDDTYSGIDWYSVETSLNTIPYLISQGYILRYGIKEGGNNKDRHFVDAQFLAFDLDEEDRLCSIEGTLEQCQKNSIKPFCVYYSPRGNPENPKQRLVIMLDEPCKDYDRLSNLSKRIRNVFTNASDPHDPCRLFYGTIRPDEMVIHLAARNNIDTLERTLPPLPEEPKTTRNQNAEDDDLDTVNRRFIAYFREHVLTREYGEDLSELVDDWIDYLNENENANLYKGVWKKRPNQGKSLISWNGTDPIHGSTTGSGDSFVISAQHDGTYVFNVDHGSFGGDLVNLFYHLRCGSWDVPHQRYIKSGENSWRGTIDQLCKIHNLESFNELENERKKEQRVSDGLLPFIIENSKGQQRIDVKLLMDQFFTEYQGRIYHCYENGRYQIYEGNYWKECKPIYLIPKVQQLVDLADYRRSDDSGASFWTAAVINQVNTYLTKCIPEHIAREPLQHDTRYFPFKNGLYDIKNRELIDFDPSITNVFVHWVDYKKVDDKPKEIFLKVYQKVCNNPEAAQAMLNWMSCAVQGRAYETKLILALVGKSRSGKTTIAEILESAMGLDLVSRQDADVLFADKERFTMNSLRSKLLLTLDDFTGFPVGTSIGKFKKLIPGTNNLSGALVTTDTKGGDHINFYFKGGIITTSENVPNFRGTIDEGTKNRFFWVHVNRCEEDLEEEFTYLKNSPDVLRWFVQQDTDFLLKNYFPKIKNEDWVIDVDRQNMINSDPIRDFFSECIERDINDTEGVPRLALYEAYRRWAATNNVLNPGTARKFGEKIKRVIEEEWNLKSAQEIIKRRKTTDNYTQLRFNEDSLGYLQLHSSK